FASSADASTARASSQKAPAATNYNNNKQQQQQQQQATKPHPDAVLQPCEFCGKRIRSLVSLQSHMVEKHLLEPGALNVFAGAHGPLGERLRIVTEDSWLAIVVKPQGVPTMGPGSLAKANWLLRQLRPSDAAAADGPYRQPRPAHRLDAGTGGLLVMAKSKDALRAICGAFEAGSVHKRYRAMVWGRFELGQEGECNEPMYGKLCCTRFRAAEAPVETADGVVSTLDLWPLTGRRHQLRRHLASLGSPILGDRRYSGRGNVARGSATERDAAVPADGLGASAPLAEPALVSAASPEEAVPTGDEDEDEEGEEGAGTQMPMFLWALQISLPHPSAGCAEVVAEIPEPKLYSDFRSRRGWFPEMAVPLRGT
ncbi:unnamed protein product, partial [Polarella glacialis]